MPFAQNQAEKLPLQTFSLKKSNDSNTGQSADSREATTSVALSHPAPYSQPMKAKFKEPDTLPQCEPISDAEFNDGLLKAANNVSKNPPQNKGTRPEAPINPSKRVRISTKRYISQY